MIADMPIFTYCLPIADQARREQVRKYAIAYLWAPKKCLFVYPKPKAKAQSQANFNRNIIEYDDLITFMHSQPQYYCQ